MAQKFSDKDISNYAKQITHLKHELQNQQQQNADFVIQLNHRVEQLASKDLELVSLRAEISKSQSDGASKLQILDKQLQYIQSLETQLQNQQSLQLLAQQQSAQIEELRRANLSHVSEMQTKDQLIQELTKQLKLLIVENAELNERMPQPFQQASELAAELEGQMASLIQGFNSLEQPVVENVQPAEIVNVANFKGQERLEVIKSQLRQLDFGGLKRDIQRLQVSELQNPDFSEITRQVTNLAQLAEKNQSIVNLQAQEVSNQALEIDRIKTEDSDKNLELAELRQQLDLQIKYNLDLKGENAHLIGSNYQQQKLLEQQAAKITNLEQLYYQIESQFKQRYLEAEERNCEILQNLLKAKQQAIEYEQSIEQQENQVKRLQSEVIQQQHLYKKDTNELKISISGIQNSVATCMQDLKRQLAEERRSNYNNYVLYQQLQSSIDEQLQLTSCIQTQQQEIMQIDETQFNQPKYDFWSQTRIVEYDSVLIQTDAYESSIILQLQNDANTSAQNIKLLQNKLTNYQNLIESLQNESLNMQDRQSKTQNFQINQLENDKTFLEKNLNAISAKYDQLSQEIKLQNDYIIQQTKIIQNLKYSETQYHQLLLEQKIFRKQQDKKEQEFTSILKEKENLLKEQKDKYLQILVSKQEVDQQVLKLKHVITELKSENQLMQNQVNQKSMQLNDIKLTQSLLQQQNMLLQSKQIQQCNSYSNSAQVGHDKDEQVNSINFSENEIKISTQDQYKIKQLNNQIIELKNQLNCKNQIIKDKEIQYQKIMTALEFKNQRSDKINRNLISVEYDKSLKQKKQQQMILSTQDQPFILDQQQQQVCMPPTMPTFASKDSQALKNEFSLAKQKDQEYKDLLTQMKSSALEQDQLKMNANQIKLHQFKLQKQDTNKSLSKRSSVSSLFDTND